MMAEAPRRTAMAGPAHADRLFTYFLVVVLGSCFGFQYAMARMMGAANVDPVGALFWIHLVLALLFVGTLIVSRRTFAVTRGQAVFFLTVALFANLGQLGIEIVAAHHISAGELTLIISLFPIFVLVMAAVFRTETLSARRMAGIAIAGACSLAILLPSALAGRSDAWWLAITFAAPVSQAVGAIIMVKFWPRRFDPLQVATGNLLAGTALLTPIAIASSQSLGLDANSANGIWATAGFAATVAGEFYIFALLTRRGGAVIASCADFVAVAAGLLFGFLFFAEVPTVWMGLAAALCLVSLKLAVDKREDLAGDLA